MRKFIEDFPQEEVPIVILDVDPQDHPDYHASELPLDEESNIVEPEYHAPRRNRARHEKSGISLYQKAKRIGASTLLIAGGAGAYVLVNGLFSGGGNKIEAKAEVEETRVYTYQNTPLQLAKIESDIDLDMTAGYDRTGPFGVDINPINNEYEFHQNNLTTNTSVTLTVAEMRVEDGSKEVLVTLGGGLDLSDASIDWRAEEFAGADIKGSSFSVGNDLKDKIDNDALEILQTSGEVAASCALRSDKVQPAITDGVTNFLKIVKPELVSNNKPLTVVIEDFDSEADRLYSESIDNINDVVDNIREDYSGKDDTFSVDVSGITDCDRQKIRIIKPKEAQ